MPLLLLLLLFDNYKVDKNKAKKQRERETQEKIICKFLNVKLYNELPFNISMFVSNTNIWSAKQVNSN